MKPREKMDRLELFSSCFMLKLKQCNVLQIAAFVNKQTHASEDITFSTPLVTINDAWKIA